MFALLKIRLIKIRRQPVKNLFLYFFPFLVALAPVLFLFLIRKLMLNRKSNKLLNYIGGENGDYILFDSSLKKFHSINKGYVICEDDTIRTSFVHFFESTCSLKSQCKIYNFTSYDSFTNHSDYYEIDYYSIVFWIKGTKSNITFTLISKQFK